MIWKNEMVISKANTTKFSRPKPLDVAHSSRKLLWFFGIYPGNIIKRHRFREISRLTSIFILASFPFLMFRRQFANERLLDGWTMVAAFCYALVRTLMYTYSEKIADAENFLELEIFNTFTPAQDRFVLRAVKYTNFYCDLIRILSSMICVLYAIFIPADVASLPAWIPVKPEPTSLHVYEVAACTISLLIYTSAEGTVTSLIVNTAVQFQILGDNLKHSCRRKVVEYYAEQEKTIQDRLEKCVRHHNTILRYCTAMEESLSAMLFWQISCSVVGLCLSGFQFLLVPMLSSRCAWCLVCVSGYSVQILSSCIFAENIIVQSSEIVESCFKADWYACSITTKKMLLLIMERAKRPTVLEVKPFFTVSLRTFVMILRNAYSYYAVLRSIYKK